MGTIFNKKMLAATVILFIIFVSSSHLLASAIISGRINLVEPELPAQKARGE